MGKHTDDMPKDVKVAWSGLIGIGVAATIVIAGIPLAILLTAFPQLLFLFAFLIVLLIGGYFHGRKS